MNKENSDRTVESTPDYFARVVAILGLFVAIIAVIVPIWQSHSDAQEHISLRMGTDSSGIVLLSDDRSATRVVQLPWLITLSNTGKVKLSITDLDAFITEEQAQTRFPHLLGALYNLDHSDVRFPMTLDAGESKTIRVYLGFMAKEEILGLLYSLQAQKKKFTLIQAFKYLAKHNRTMYGGVVEYREIDGSLTITTDSQFYVNEPVYQLEFRSGRNEVFSIRGSETTARFSN
ncbi:hypothetical protein L1D14_25160 [Vibrio tubiashii]|uniref:hypothetical protein n=1 Tax=Vibrio tubiashii TaxID=29498 RepID=UPI001EFE452A|nr:hypothetical protein [Vibrio tubiashii]MCG9579501.1 hypothetical protein [Vibrio tubiashii]